MSYFRHNFGGDKDLERRYVAALKRALDHTFRMKELEKGEPMNTNELIEALEQRYGNPYMAKEYALIHEAIAVLREMAKAQEK
jgi:hypothetical protein